MLIIPIILLGGSGTRLWPVSRKNHPKQFLNLTGDKTLLQSTLLRLITIDQLQSPIVICNERHRFTTAEQLAEIDKELGDIILEPVGKNTAPAVAIGALRALQKHDDALLLVLPSDHLIKDTTAFLNAIETASKLVQQQEKLVTFGVVPTKPETGYGYIKQGKLIEEQVYHVANFVEKPDIATAQKYIKSGTYLWNSGIFLFKASSFLNELKRLEPEMLACCKQSLEKAQHDLDFIRLDKEIFSTCPSDSIDYAVMEKTKDVVTIPLDAGWSDVGSWDALWEVEHKDENNNVLHGDVIINDSSNCLVRAENKLVSLVGINDVVVIETKDAVLVATKDKVQNVKTVVEQLRKENRSEADMHREAYRPWGKYDCIDKGYRFQVKRITVKPGESISLQRHFHRSEHWIIVSGMAEVTCDNKVFLCPENHSAYIPQGSVHRIVNPGKLPLKMIEVQTGSYLGEDDIVRLEDHYGRIKIDSSNNNNNYSTETPSTAATKSKVK